MSALWIGGAAIALMSVAVKMPTLKHAHRLIVNLRASWLLAGEMWQGAMLRRSRWNECVQKAARDV